MDSFTCVKGSDTSKKFFFSSWSAWHEWTYAQKLKWWETPRNVHKNNFCMENFSLLVVYIFLFRINNLMPKTWQKLPLILSCLILSRILRLIKDDEWHSKSTHQHSTSVMHEWLSSMPKNISILPKIHTGPSTCQKGPDVPRIIVGWCLANSDI